VPTPAHRYKNITTYSAVAFNSEPQLSHKHTDIILSAKFLGKDHSWVTTIMVYLIIFIKIKIRFINYYNIVHPAKHVHLQLLLDCIFDNIYSQQTNTNIFKYDGFYFNMHYIDFFSYLIFSFLCSITFCKCGSAVLCILVQCACIFENIVFFLLTSWIFFPCKSCVWDLVFFI
jgi:hypothetical protein